MVTPGLRRLLPAVAASICCLGALAAGCDKVALTAPTQSVITLFTNATVVPLNGSAEITATVVEPAGTVVQNGTLVTFTTTIGTIDPPEARTNNGKVTVRFVAANVSGTARIGAFSGSTRATEIEITVGAAAVARVVLNASPGSVPASGGSVTLVATVTDASGNRLPGIPVTFTASVGNLLSGTVLTDERGEARTVLTTNRQAQVTATAGNQQSQVTVNVDTPIAVSISSTTANPTVGQPVTFQVSATASSNSPPLREVFVDFGDGRSALLGTPASSTTVTHVYSASGTYTVTATATDVTGNRSTASTQINVSSATRPLVTLTAPATTAINSIFTVSVGIAQNPSNLAVESVEFNFGDGNVKRVNGLQTTHAYGVAGNYNIRATVFFAGGTTSSAEAGIRVTLAP